MQPSIFPEPTPQPYPEDHPLTLVARYYEAMVQRMRGKGHKTNITDRYFQGRYFVSCDTPGCHASLAVILHEGHVYLMGRGAELWCPVATLEANQGQPAGLDELLDREKQAMNVFMTLLEKRPQ